MDREEIIGITIIPLDKIEKAEKSKVDIYLISFLILRCISKFLHLLSGQTADKNNILLKLRPTGLLKIRSVNFSCKANFICLCQITLYSFSSFSISVLSIFFRTALNAIFSRSVGFISVIFLPSRS